MSEPLRPFLYPWARIAGALYLVIIVCGLFGELAVRGTLVVPGDAAATAEAIAGNFALFRAGFAADTIMLLADAVLAFVLYMLLKPAGVTLALVAAALRLSQTAVLGLNLLNMIAALLLIQGAPYLAGMGEAERQALASLFLDLHAHGYDLGLIFFGAHCLAIGALLIRSDAFPGFLGWLLIGGGAVYLLGSYVRFLAPGLMGAITPLYAVCLAAELTFGLWLLIKGPRADMRFAPRQIEGSPRISA